MFGKAKNTYFALLTTRFTRVNLCVMCLRELPPQLCVLICSAFNFSIWMEKKHSFTFSLAVDEYNLKIGYMWMEIWLMSEMPLQIECELLASKQLMETFLTEHWFQCQVKPAS